MAQLKLRPAASRGTTRIDWLDSRHTFSFGGYHDPAHMNFRSLRVINDDRVAAGMGFGEHGHRDMEILTFVLEGELAHRDSLGNGSVIRPGDAQIMSAGTGIRHSEFNPSANKPAHFLQVWMQPEKQGLPPRYDQKHFADDQRRDRWRLIVSRDARDGSLRVFQDADLFAATLSPGAGLRFDLKSGRHAWLHVATGAVKVNGTAMQEGDGASTAGPAELTVAGVTEAQVLLFDLG